MGKFRPAFRDLSTVLLYMSSTNTPDFDGEQTAAGKVKVASAIDKASNIVTHLTDLQRISSLMKMRKRLVGVLD
jgi:hypothetical protein